MVLPVYILFSEILSIALLITVMKDSKEYLQKEWILGKSDNKKQKRAPLAAAGL